MFESNRRSFFSAGAQERQVEKATQTQPVRGPVCPPGQVPVPQGVSDETTTTPYHECMSPGELFRLMRERAKPAPSGSTSDVTPAPAPSWPPYGRPMPTEPPRPPTPTPTGTVPTGWSWAPTQHPKSIDWGPVPKPAPPKAPTPTPFRPQNIPGGAYDQTPYQPLPQPAPQPTGVAPRTTIPFLPFSMT